MSYSESHQTSPSEALTYEALCSPQRFVKLPSDICIGAASVGGFLACVMTKHAVMYASQQPKSKHQTDLRSAHVQFYRPIFPDKDAGVEMKLREVNIGRAWSTFRVELTHGHDAKLAASADVTVCNLHMHGKTLPTNWGLTPPARRLDLARLETLGNPDWACYHTAFHPAGFRRGMSYVKYYVPRKVPQPVKFVEQWITPGWDCEPCGSRKETTGKATWTNELIQFVADLSLPVQENFWPAEVLGSSLGSIVATLAFAARQRLSYDEGRTDWRQLSDDGSLPEDGSKLFKNSMINVTLSMSTEIKKKLPEEGIRWLYMRTEAKRLENSRLDIEIILLDETLDLVAISHQVAWIVAGMQKTQKSSTL
ncbi:hypothetical protein K491DRAFT_639238 [Lophiostoma macrostomum CBS 122681]|uniref:Thioesterase domain-containing protein n=1 Tax=Lophiostoma macrostomum CBS 122681 TaxID=1314788 RepID=A0A6A6SUU3_9PLEO|nr:hypothetical protein K491DRAFT_639238 [Lophiostoma macrostomum CBS 122681]